MNQKQFYPFLFDTANKWLAVSLCIASFFLLIYELKTVFTSPKTLQKLTLAPPKDILPVKIAKDSTLFKNALFGEYVPMARGEAMNLPLLDLEVMGILYADQGKASQVIIKMGSEERIFSVGDSVPGGAVIQKIKKNTITVLYNGELRSLALAKPALTFSVPSAPLI